MYCAKKRDEESDALITVRVVGEHLFFPATHPLVYSYALTRQYDSE